MLDVKQDGGGLAYCDIIIYTDNVTAWDQAIRKHYRDWSLSEKIISGGHKIEVCSSDTKDTLVSVNFYHKTNRFMVQPGDFKESNLRLFLAEVPAIRCRKWRYWLWS